MNRIYVTRRLGVGFPIYLQHLVFSANQTLPLRKHYSQTLFIALGASAEAAIDSMIRANHDAWVEKDQRDHPSIETASEA
jgi:hypothetical protein